MQGNSILQPYSRKKIQAPIGTKFGRWTILDDAHDGRWLCECECGIIRPVRSHAIRKSISRSCGCLGLDNATLAKITHGMSHTRVFKIWIGMLDRCKNDRSGNYGGRGISVCQEWLESFEAFYADMGERPTSKHSIDRKDVNGPYSPENCRWATGTEQARNTRRNTLLTFNGETLTLSEWSEKTGIKAPTLCVRLYKLGWSIDKTLSAPVVEAISDEIRQGVRRDWRQSDYSYRALGRQYGISHHAVKRIVSTT